MLAKLTANDFGTKKEHTYKSRLNRFVNIKILSPSTHIIHSGKYCVTKFSHLQEIEL